MAERSIEPRYTYADYKNWPEDVRGELIDGVFYDMSPGPHPNHQRLVGIIFQKLANYLEGKSCIPFSSPIDVAFGHGEEDIEDSDDIVQPDIAVVCDPKQITRRGIRGAPRMIVEVLSPSTAGKDQGQKRLLYMKNGVQEYWVVSPMARLIDRYTLVDGTYDIAMFDDGRVESASLPGFAIDLATLFAEMLDIPE